MYNVQAYIQNCLESFCIPDIMEQLEVLVVDDGSKDESAEIAGNFEKKFPNTFRIIHKKNGGHGSTINVGIQEAQGKYFKVVDGDDWVDGYAFQKLMQVLSKKDADIICSDFKWVYSGTEKEKIGVNEPFPGVNYGQIYSFYDICDNLYIKMHSMTIKTEILKEHFRPLDEHCFYVDWEYTAYPIPYVETILFIQDCVYMYRVGLEGQSVNIKNMQKNINHHLTVLYSLMDFYEEYYGTDFDGLNEKESKKAQYLAHLIGRVVASQIKIYLSYPVNRENKRRLVEFDKKIRERNHIIYTYVTNKSVWLLRRSHYMLYAVAAYLVGRRGRG